MADMEFSHNMGAYGRGPERSAPPQDGSTSLVTMTNLAGAVVSLARIGGVAVWGYELMMRDVSGIPVVRAAEGEMRVRPENPGGELAQHQGLSVNAIAADGVAAGPVDQVILAPRAMMLSSEDQPVIQTAAPPIEQPAPLAPAGSSQDQASVDAEFAEPSSDLTALLQQGAIDDVVAELTAGNTPMVSVPGAKTVKPTRATPEETATGDVEANAEPVAEARPAPAVLNAPGVRRSMRPKLRPAELKSLVQPASFVSAAAPQEIDAAAIPAGTRLAQLGAFESADVARSEWTRLEGRFGDYLQDKSRVVQQAQSGGRTFYRLRAMGFTDLSDTRRFCSVFKAEGVDCIPVQVK